MINAKELRIGNSIIEYRFDFEKGQMADVIIGVTATTITQASLNTNNFFPIELTEDVLIKCGFAFKSNSYLILDKFNSKFILWAEKEGYLFQQCQNIKHTKVKYLHQLQNLYFALTGKELNVELNAQVSDTTKMSKE